MGVPSEDRFRSPAELHLPPQDRPKPRISRKALHVQKPYNNKKRCVRKTKTLHRCVYTIEIERERQKRKTQSIQAFVRVHCYVTGPKSKYKLKAPDAETQTESQ